MKQLSNLDLSMNPKYSVVVFAYNEQELISDCLDSIFNNSDENLHSILVLANGCTDQTVEIAKTKADQNSIIKVREIALGDKCNAWNKYIHQYSETATPIHFFVDSDVTFQGNVFSVLSKKLHQNVNANAAAGCPLSGRHRENYLNLIKDRFCLFGNCYALKSEFITQIRSMGFYLPVGLMWIDSAITKAVNSDLLKQEEGFEDRIIHDPACGYRFDSISPFSWSDIKLYFARLARYEAGKQQEQHLKQLDFSQWPSDLKEINQRIMEDIELGRAKVPSYLRRAVIRKLSRLLLVDL